MDRYLKIINHFGVRTQMKKLNEEVYEFLEAVANFEDYKSRGMNDYHLNVVFRDHMIEEMSDILVLIQQFIAKYEINKDEIDKHMDYKLERTEKRIKDNYYDKNNN